MGSREDVILDGSDPAVSPRRLPLRASLNRRRLGEPLAGRLSKPPIGFTRSGQSGGSTAGDLHVLSRDSDDNSPGAGAAFVAGAYK
jgi:hypothetical protein